MGKLYSIAVGVSAAILIASAAQADGPDISAQRLLSAWKGEDPNMRMVAEVIASAFASGLSWKGTLGGKEVYCPPQGLKGGQVMTTLDQFLGAIPTWQKSPMATRWRRRSAERSRARHNRPALRQRTRLIRIEENLTPTRCEQGVSGLISTFRRPQFQGSPLARGSCSGMSTRSNTARLYLRAPACRRTTAIREGVL